MNSAETKAKLCDAHKGKLNSAETRDKISITSGTIIYVYSSDKSTLINTFCSANKAAESFDCSTNTILTYAKSGKLLKDKWILSLSLK